MNILDRYIYSIEDEITPIEEINTIEDFRAYSDDIGIFTYAVLWFIFGISFVFVDDYYIDQANEIYKWFDIMAIIFIILNYKLREMYGRTGFLKKTNGKLLFACMVAVGGYLVIVYAIWQPLTYTFPRITASFSSDLLYQVARTIPLEELVFRGFGMSLIGIFFTKIFGIDDNLKFASLTAEVGDDHTVKIRYIFAWTIAIVITGLLFGIYHIPAYTTPDFPYIAHYNQFGIAYYESIIVPLLFLSILGMWCGYVRYKWGLFPAILVHILNNILASAIIVII